MSIFFLLATNTFAIENSRQNYRATYSKIIEQLYSKIIEQRTAKLSSNCTAKIIIITAKIIIITAKK